MPPKTEYDVRNRGLTELDPNNFPSNMRTLICSQNKLTELPELPKTLSKLYCVENLLTSLPDLPDGLTVLSCPENPLGQLPDILPKLLQRLICYNCGLTSLPFLPENLKGWVWNSRRVLDTKWLKNYNNLKKLEKPPTRKDNLSLFNWANDQRKLKKTEKLEKEKINLFGQITWWFWSVDLNKLWMTNHDNFKKYVIENKKFPVYKSKLMTWYGNQIQKYDKLTKNKQILLDILKEMKKD